MSLLSCFSLFSLPDPLSAQLSYSEQVVLLNRVRSAPLARGQDMLGCSVVTGEASIAAPKLPKPAYLGFVRDPVFGHRIVRITGDPKMKIPNAGSAKWGNMERHHYSTDQPWNANGTLLVLDKSKPSHLDLYLDGETYEVLFARKLMGGGERRWHPTKPELRIYVRKNEIGYWNPITDRRDVVATLKGYSSFKFGPSKGGPSHDGSRITILAKDKNNQCVAFAYDLNQRRKYADIPISGCKGWVTMSPLGDYVLHQYGNDRKQIYDLEGNPVGPTWSAYGEPSHYDLGVTTDGKQVAIGINKNPKSPDKQKMIMRYLADGSITRMTSKMRFSHTSAKNYRRPGWAYSSGYEDIAAIKLDGSNTIERYGKTRSVKNGYYTEPHAVPSPDGRKVLFGSNWGEKSGSIGAYVLEICK